MTFEEWCDSKSKAGFQSDTKQFMELAWNAAIEAAQDLLMDGDYYWPMDNPTGLGRPKNKKAYAELEIDQLKTD